MEIITIDGMVENDFRLSIEDMLRLNQVDAAIERLRALLESSGCVGPVLPVRFLEVTSADLEFGGWHRLPDRLLDHDRPNFPITAIGVTLADARQLGGPGPDGGRLSPFIKTFYFSDEAYPFTEATRDDLLDGYSRDGFELQGDYRATDATLSVKGIDDLYGAIIELESRLFDSPDPSEDEIRAGAIGSCFLAALIHQALRDAIRQKGLPRPLCVFAACDGVYPFFDAPVAGSDECSVAPAAPALAEDAPPQLTDDTGQAEDGEEVIDEQPAEASLLSLFVRREGKAPVMVLDAHDAQEAARFSESAGAQRMDVDAGLLVGEALEFVHFADPADAPFADDGVVWSDRETFDRPVGAAEVPDPPSETPCEQSDDLLQRGSPTGELQPDTRDCDGHSAGQSADLEDDIEDEPGDAPDCADEVVMVAEEVPFEPLAAPASHSLRARIKLAQPPAKAGLRDRMVALWGRVRRMILRG